MTESELREQVAKKLRRDDLPGELWQDLVDRRFIQGVLQGDESISDVVKEVKRELRLTQQLAKRSTPPGRKAHVVAPPSLQAHERARAQALAEWLGHHVATIPRVRHLREKLFAGGTLSAEQAQTLLKSKALRFLSATQCTALGIPLVGHEARIEMEDKLTSTHRIIDVTFHIVWPDGAYDETLHWEEELHGRGTRLKEILLPRLQKDGQVEVWPESVLGELYTCSTWLAQRYPWKESEGIWFVLTGEYPPVLPVELYRVVQENRDLYRHRIMLSVDPWVSAQTVARAYRAVQDMVLAGRDNRPLRERSLALVRFVASKRDPQGKRPRWKTLMEVWNRMYPLWAYDREATFARDIGRAELNVRFPPYRGTLGPGDKRPLPNAQLEGREPISLAEEAPFFWQRQRESAG